MTNGNGLTMDICPCCACEDTFGDGERVCGCEIEQVDDTIVSFLWCNTHDRQADTRSRQRAIRQREERQEQAR